jgi:transaldolase / glucose-6-phosphate isomerase
MESWRGWGDLADDWRRAGKTTRIFERDASVWTGADEDKWLGWLDVADRQLGALGELKQFQASVLERGFTDILLLGMGGSSLCPDVLSKTFGRQNRGGRAFPRLHVVDSTDPAQVQAAADAVDLSRTLVFVSSKSGSTLEPDILRRYFFARVGACVDCAGDRFVAVTDPRSQLEGIARDDGYWRIFAGEPRIGGRYSALSAFGIAPAAAMGLDVEALLRSARAMAERCRAAEPAENPGVRLGIFLGWLAAQGRDKVTFLTSSGLASLGGWLEQLLAESTGKHGKAIIPVDLEEPGPPETYAADRVFVSLQLGDDAPSTEGLNMLEAAGHPVVRIVCPTKHDIAAEFYRWEIATAVAGAVMGLNPFDQPDVEASKIKTKALMQEVENGKPLPGERPFAAADGIELFASDRGGAELAPAGSLEGILRAHFDRLKLGDYFGLLAYLPMFPEMEAQLSELRMTVRDARKVATCMGFGPRFLHSTGQAYKGGPNTGVFLQVTAAPKADIGVPGKQYSFGVVEAAQARGDLEVLHERGRRALRAHLTDLDAGLPRLVEAAKRAAKA